MNRWPLRGGSKRLASSIRVPASGRRDGRLSFSIASRPSHLRHCLPRELLHRYEASESPEIGESAHVSRFPGFTPATRISGHQSAAQSAWSQPTALLDAIDEGVIQLGELSLDQKQALAAHPDQQLRRRAQQLLERGGALAQRGPTGGIGAAVARSLEQAGDPVAGKEVFKKQCAKCHMHSGEGSPRSAPI